MFGNLTYFVTLFYMKKILKIYQKSYKKVSKTNKKWKKCQKVLKSFKKS